MQPKIQIIGLFLFFCSTTCFLGCTPKYETVAHVLKEGYISCFAEGLTYAKERVLSAEQNKDFSNITKPKPVTAEISGIAYYHNMLVMVNDKPIPGTTPLMIIPYDKPFIYQRVNHIGNEDVKNALKFEDITLTPDLKYMFMITAFDRINDENFSQDSYNLLFYRELKDSLKGYDEIAYPEFRNGEVSSLGLRKKIKNALKSKIYKNGPQYFKVEALAAIPDDILLIGIREVGNSYKDFKYVTTILGAKYTITDNEFFFTEKLKVIYRFEQNLFTQLNLPVGLSSMEYDNFNKRLILLTSYEHGETDEDVGGYLWSLSMYDFWHNLPPALVKVEDEKTHQLVPLHFAHKAEGVAILDAHTIFVIHDDDRRLGHEVITDPKNQFKKKYNQAAYSIVQFD